MERAKVLNGKGRIPRELADLRAYVKLPSGFGKGTNHACGVFSKYTKEELVEILVFKSEIFTFTSDGFKNKEKISKLEVYIHWYIVE